ERAACIGERTRRRLVTAQGIACRAHRPSRQGPARRATPAKGGTTGPVVRGGGRLGRGGRLRRRCSAGPPLAADGFVHEALEGQATGKLRGGHAPTSVRIDPGRGRHGQRLAREQLPRERISLAESDYRGGSRGHAHVPTTLPRRPVSRRRRTTPALRRWRVRYRVLERRHRARWDAGGTAAVRCGAPANV